MNRRLCICWLDRCEEWDFRSEALGNDGLKHLE